jgi:hypothetical protein
MTKSNGRNGRVGRRTRNEARDRRDETPPDHEAFAAKVERLRRLLAELIARRIHADRQRLPPADGAEQVGQ